MPETPKVSVIVPVYNSEKYLQHCINSIINQSFTDFELILINDGSKDNSKEICDRNAEADKRIKVVHQKNSGVSYARNVGIEIASGDYICFIDSDDWVEKDYLLKLYEKADLYDLIILTNISYDYPNYCHQRCPNYSTDVYSRNNFVNFFLENDFFTIGDGGCCSKLFKKSIINKNVQRFILNNAAYEDTLFTYEYITKCKTIQIVYGPHYHYVNRTVKSLSKIKHPYQNYLDSGLKGIELTESLINDSPIPVNYSFNVKGITKFLNIFNYSIFSLYSSYNKVNKIERLEIIYYIKKINDLYKKYYKSMNLKYNIINGILCLKNKELIDRLFIILFSTTKKIKK